MPTYKKGVQTKEDIINCAKKLFYIYGYKSVTVQQICKEADIKLGTFTYYFNKKEDLLRTLYNTYMKECHKYTSKMAPEYVNAQHHIASVCLYYINLYRDNNIINFHKEILNMGSMNFVFENPEANIDDFCIEGNVPLHSKEHDLFVLADNAVRRELNLLFINGSNHALYDVKQLLSDIYLTSGKIFGVDADKVNHYVDVAYQYVLDHLDNNIRLI